MSSSVNASALMASLMEDGSNNNNNNNNDNNGSASPEEDLFGEIPIDDEPLPLAQSSAMQQPITSSQLVPPMQDQQPFPFDGQSNHSNNSGSHPPPPPSNPPPPPPSSSSQQQQNQPAPAPSSSLLSKNDLLTNESTSNGGDAGGMFDNLEEPQQTKPATATSAAPSLLSKSGLLMDDTSTDGDGLFDQVDQEQRQIEEEKERERKRQQAILQAKQEQQRLEQERLEQQRLEQQRQEQQRLEQQRQEQQRLEQQRLQQQQQMQQQQMQQQQMQQQNAMAHSYHAPQQQYHQQPSSILQSQSVMLPSAANPNTNNANFNQINNQMQGMTISTNSNSAMSPQQGFYRDHQPTTPSSNEPNNTYTGPSASNVHGNNSSNNTNNYNISNSVGPYQTPNKYPNNNNNNNNANYYYGTQQQQQQPLQPSMAGSATAGMHNASNMGRSAMGQVRPLNFSKPKPFTPLYSKIVVSEPMMIQSPGMFGGPPYWSYLITSYLAPTSNANQNQPGVTWLVRRRFRHVVALEDRLRQAAPGAILPPRPAKHATRALEEASTQQSVEFAKQRSEELEVYMDALAKHPVVGTSNVLKLFLNLQDDLGVAWPEVSNNAFTRLGAVGIGMSIKVAETTSNTSKLLPGSGSASGTAAGGVSVSGSGVSHEWEDDAELLSLASSEQLRMGAVQQAVPKLEGAVTLFRDVGDSAGAVGMEVSKLASQVEGTDRELSQPLEILSNGLLRYARRTKRLALELSAAFAPFGNQYKLCRYERLAFADRRQALQKRGQQRTIADRYAQQYVGQHHQQHMYGQQQQQQYNPYGSNQIDRLEHQAVLSDGIAMDAVHDCDAIGNVLKSEVYRVAFQRRTEWHASMKVMASAFREASAERLAIWESTRETFLQTFPPEGA